MLLRQDGDGVIAISQPSHAWLAGQLARGWGNAAFERPAPHEEVCLGAELHDIGWLSWESAPVLNPDSGLPQDFREVPVATHVDLWRSGVRRALQYGRYPALIVSLHADTIYGSYFQPGTASEEERGLVRALLDEQHAFQRECVAALSANPRHAGRLGTEALERNRLLVAAVDLMSLHICWGVRQEIRVPLVPTMGEGRTALILRSPGQDPAALTVSPWPFAADRLELVAEGRRLPGRFTDETAMRRALGEAETAVLTVTLSPG
ncbi:DUF3891 family protein [Azospirillum thermophilum]|uniref:DUF3891 domain-containing protein n=1 Tax=Azospirillum thermophilum TaxID=2202148 RepID=A0A2S2CSM7_9PROT|nr:DUF3891 family protein [Azospirillum thermophilum]AWK87297.1 DUF3891 domain-containing protein [Azospirillum thermophilum]